MISHLLPNKAKTPDISVSARHDLARLLHMVAFGERIATDCAHWQSKAASDVRSKRFFRAQSRHERFHGSLFRQGASWLSPERLPADYRFRALTAYRDRLNAAIRHNRWLEVIVGQQLVLEGIGEVVLNGLDKGMSQHDIGFGQIRKLILRQEHAHHTFGLRLLDDELTAERTGPETLTALAMPYLELADTLLTDCAPLLESIEVDATDYRHELWSELPQWLNREWLNREWLNEKSL